MSSTPCASLGESSLSLTELSPEVILEIASHISKNEQLSSAKRETDNSLVDYASFRQSSLCNLRLVCRYLSEVLEHVIFKSLTFNFDSSRVNKATQVYSQLSTLSCGESVVSRRAMSLQIKQLDPYNRLRRSSYRTDPKDKAVPKSINRILDNHLEKAILSLQNLRSVEWNIGQIDDHTTRTMTALSSLPLLESVTLWIGPTVAPARLLINQLSGLRSFEVNINKHPRYYGSSADVADNFVDHLAEAIQNSPCLRHLSILQPARHKYDVSFCHLTRNIPMNSPLSNLKFLHLALTELNVDETALAHLKSLTTLHVEGSAHELCTGAEFWSALTTAQIKLLDITVGHLSEPLVKYLSSYSGLDRLHISLKYYPHEQYTTCDVEHFFKCVIPLHNLTPSVNIPPVAVEIDGSPGNQGLAFVTPREPLPQAPITMLQSWTIDVCIDSIPSCLPLLLGAMTQSKKCRMNRLNIKLSSTMLYFGCGTGMMSYMRNRFKALNEWATDLEIGNPEKYPAQISLDRHLYHLASREENTSAYVYRRDPEEERITRQVRQGWDWSSDSN